jgi:predicted ribosomally synthesized peptide with SipW-like signal peptide
MTQILNARILASLGMIVFVAAVVASSTGAFFSDTETSTGNTFTAGSLDLKVDSQSHYNGMRCSNENGFGSAFVWIPDEATSPFTPADATTFNNANPDQFPRAGDPCGGTWAESDLIEDSIAFRFFDFSDIKPGDEGENTISLHVTDNDAWACMTVDNVSDLDVTCTEPESEDADDVSCMADIAADGELGANLTFDAWLDEGTTPGFQCNNANAVPTVGASCAADPQEGDNVMNGVEALFWDDETVDEASEGPFALSDVLSGAYAAHTCTDVDGNTAYAACHGLASDGRMVGSATYYWGLAWNVPDEAGNEIQTDSLVMDMVFEVEQHRNNDNFQCTPSTEPEPETATLTIDKAVTFSSTSVVGVDVTDFTLHINGPGGDQILTDETPLAGLAPGVYTVSEVYSNNPAGLTWDAVFSGACSEIAVDTETGTITLAAGDNVTCNLTNVVDPLLP